MDEIIETFGFREIELAVLERTAGELAGLCGPHVPIRRQRRKQRGQDGASAMDMELGNVLAGRARGLWKPEHDRVVQWLTVSGLQQRPCRYSRRRHLTRERRNDSARRRTRHPHDGDRAGRAAGGKGEDGLVAWMHCLIVPGT